MVIRKKETRDLTIQENIMSSKRHKVGDVTTDMVKIVAMTTTLEIVTMIISAKVKITTILTMTSMITKKALLTMATMLTKAVL